MKKVLFYTANGVGLGHLRRAQLIAERLKKERAKIILATSSLFPQRLGRFFSHLVKLNPLTEELINYETKYLSNREENKQKLNKAINKFKPDVIVSDIYLSDYAFYPLEKIFGRFLGRKIYVWRLSFNKPVLELRKNSYKLSHFDKIIIPHDRNEIAFHSKLFLKIIESNKKFEITGPIYKKINKKNLSSIRKKYQLSPGDFILTITLGAGGGNLEGCQSPSEMLESFINIYPKLIKNIPNLKVIFSTGPYFRKVKNFPKIKIIKFEKNLSELFCLSSLVVSTAGYNTCNELIEAEAPSVLIPLERGNREQFKRTEYLENKGICHVVKNVSPENLLKAILESKDSLVQMKKNFENFSNGISGSAKVAKLILNLL